ncbi:class I adenylate-forming enzyme family protein [Pseudonocardia acaciae]|uniref:class I adenylate-forming enzyme family protein n=1 Tax=Pseudonocardia acaciae TaxID=551276 RepID=UPI00048D7A57|nr:AMP-binding protein [Pseudonocardia acaciae]
MANLLTPLRRATQVGSARTAVTCGELELTYAQTWDRCRRLVDALQYIGVDEGDRVAVVGPNCHRYLEIYQALPGAGMTVVPLNPELPPSELRHALADSGAKALFTGIGDIGPGHTVEHVFDLGDGYERLLASAVPADLPEDGPEDRVAGLFYTGGTTGSAKGVMLTHRNLLANASHLAMSWPFTPETTWLVTAPLFHVVGSLAVLTTVWSAGAHVVLPEFDPARALDLIERHRVTATMVVPSMLAAMSEEQLARPRDVSSLRLLGHGGSPCATQTLHRAHAAFPSAELLHFYGATETAPIATLLPREERRLGTARERSCGQPALGVDVVVFDVDGVRCSPGEVGELTVRGPNVMAGYWNRPAETAIALVDGWYRTGDLGYQDEEGFVYLVDRARDMIVSGGENVYSTDVEDALYRHPAVLEAAVVAVPDERWGEAVHAVVVLRAEVSEEELIAHCRSLLAGHEVPRTVERRREPLPRSGAGKPLKRELREPHWSGVAARA